MKEHKWSWKRKSKNLVLENVPKRKNITNQYELGFIVEETWITICPKCKKPFAPGKSLANWFGIIPLGQKCRFCGYAGGPIRVKEEDFKKLRKD
jgi:RNase P subunit RPR2